MSGTRDRLSGKTRRPAAVRRGVSATQGQSPSAMPLPALWSVRALSQHWRISRQQIYEAHKDGRLRGFRVLGTLRFLEADLLAYLTQEGVPAKGE